MFPLAWNHRVWYFLPVPEGPQLGLAMTKFARAAVIAAGFAAVSAAGTVARADVSPSLTSFGTSRAISSYELSASGVPVVVVRGLELSASRGGDGGAAELVIDAERDLFR